MCRLAVEAVVATRPSRDIQSFLVRDRSPTMSGRSPPHQWRRLKYVAGVARTRIFTPVRAKIVGMGTSVSRG